MSLLTAHNSIKDNYRGDLESLVGSYKRPRWRRPLSQARRGTRLRTFLPAIARRAARDARARGRGYQADEHFTLAILKAGQNRRWHVHLRASGYRWALRLKRPGRV